MLSVLGALLRVPVPRFTPRCHVAGQMLRKRVHASVGLEVSADSERLSAALRNRPSWHTSASNSPRPCGPGTSWSWTTWPRTRSPASARRSRRPGRPSPTCLQPRPQPHRARLRQAQGPAPRRRRAHFRGPAANLTDRWARSNGFAALVSKPIFPQELLRAVRRCSEHEPPALALPAPADRSASSEAEAG